MSMFSYKRFCWSLGTTSFRTTDFNVKIESQLALLSEFKALPQSAGRLWFDLQVEYYQFMHKKGFVKGNAPNPAKDARQKTSGLVDIGLIDSERNLTEVGRVLLSIAQNSDFKSNNPLQIPKDSFIYLKQLLKMSDNIDGNVVRPFVVAAYVVSKLDYLSNDEFTYLLPLCINKEKTNSIIKDIFAVRNKSKSIDDIIIDTLMSMDNYKSALQFFQSNKVTEDVIGKIGINRKSGSGGVQNYDKPYFKFYTLLHDVVLNKNAESVLLLLEQSSKINGKAATLWRKALFQTTARTKVQREKLGVLTDVPIFNAGSESEFRQMFFEMLHLYKAKATLSDYFDLNRRYCKTTDTLLFADGKVEFDVIPSCWIKGISDQLPQIAFTPIDTLISDIELSAIASFLAIDITKLYSDLERLFGIRITSGEDASELIQQERYKRFNKLIDERFSKEILIDLFSKFESRNDDSIRQIVTNNADIPTIFEYVLGIAWFVISGRKGRVLEFMNLSLEADLLPRTHAQGGNADIEYHYPKTSEYPAHCLLIEATLADSTNQRRMEMEPVSRHLGDYILSTGDENAYCVFVSTYLHRNVISDFCNRKTYQYYGKNDNFVDGLKILPLATAEIKAILQKGIDYNHLYSLFEEAYQNNVNPAEWYEEYIFNQINMN